MDKEFKEFKKDRRDIYKPDRAFNIQDYMGDDFIIKSEKIRDQIVKDMIKEIKNKMKRLKISDDNMLMLRFVCCKTIMKTFEGMFFLYDKTNDVELELSYDLLQGGAEFDKHETKVMSIIKKWSEFVLNAIYNPVIYSGLCNDNTVINFYTKQVNDSLELVLHGIK